MTGTCTPKLVARGCVGPALLLARMARGRDGRPRRRGLFFTFDPGFGGVFPGKGRRKEEGERKKEEGRRKKEEGRKRVVHSAEDAAYLLSKSREHSFDHPAHALLHGALVERAQASGNRVAFLEVFVIGRTSFDRARVGYAAQHLL